MIERSNKLSTMGALAGLLLAVGCAGPQTEPKPSGEVAEQSAPAAEPLPPVEQTRALQGADGLKVSIVELEGDDALVEVRGVDSDVTGLVVRTTRVRDGAYLRYQTMWHGRTWNVVVQRERNGGSTWTAYLPGSGRRDGFALRYLDEPSEVDAQALVAQHQAQWAEGVLQELAAFDRAAEEAAEEASLAQDLQRAQKECGHAFDYDVAWDTVSQERLIDKSISGYCGSLLSGLRNICRTEAGRKFVQARIETATCRLDGDHELSFEGKKLTWAIGFDTYNLDQAAGEALLATSTTEGTTVISLQDRILAEQTQVCTDESGEHLVVLGPEEAPHGGMAYGTGKKLYRIPVARSLGDGWFFDPRFRNEKNNPDFRGYDLRVFSTLKVDEDKGTCELSCGSRKVPLQLLSVADKRASLAGVTYQASPHTREPYALARDSYGTYYYVDRGNTKETARDFQLYRGKRGVVQTLKMKDVVSDSGGEIFSSESGELRLLLSDKGARDAPPKQAQWIKGNRSTDLVTLPLVDNYQMIYNELGMYLGEELGLPCDDL